MTYAGSGGTSPTTEWVHPSVARLFRSQGPSVFGTGALATADADAAREAVRRHKEQKRSRDGGNRPGSEDVMSTLRLLEKQVLAMAGGGARGSGGA